MFSADIGFYALEPVYIFDIFYLNSNLEDWHFKDCVNMLKYINVGDEYFTDEEVSNYHHVLSDYYVGNVSDKEVFHSIEEYRQFYQDAIPDRCKVDSYELFGENDKVMVKGN